MGPAFGTESRLDGEVVDMPTFDDDRNIFLGAEAQSMFLLDAFGDNLMEARMEARTIATINYRCAQTSADEKTWLRVLEILHPEENRLRC
jgi:hypothetical protein